MPKKQNPTPNSVPKALRRLALTEKRLAANRANAAKSTGPRTPEGKSRSSQNAVKHGFNATSFTVARLEDIREVERLKADAVAVYQPVNSQELFAVERIALAQQQILRGQRLEAGLFTDAFDTAINTNGTPISTMTPDMLEGNVPITRTQNRNYALAEGFRRMAAQQSNAWTLMLRYQAQAERMYRRAIEEFERLKALRPELPNEPIWQDQPEEKPELATAEELLGFSAHDYPYHPEIPPLVPAASSPQPVPAVASSQTPTPPANS